MNWFRPKFDLQGKFRLLAIVGLLIWLFYFSVVYTEIRQINQATLSLERVEDLYNTILEIRRYEKNYLLYQGRENLRETNRYFDRARQIYTELASKQGNSKDLQVLSGLNNALRDYDFGLDAINKSGPGSIPGETVQEHIRIAGKQMVDFSQQLLIHSRNKVAQAARNALRWPLLTMGLILVLLVLGVLLVNRKVVKPLVELERATEKIGRGDFGPIRHTNRIESEVDRLVLSFNRMVEELEARQEQIIHTRKIASLGTLVSGVAHELNNPINNIILTVDTLVGGRKITEERRAAMLDDILTQAIRASGIVKNLLDFSRAETATTQDVDLAQLLRETIKIAGNQITINKINLHQDIPADLPLVQGNRQGLQQVFLNLIINAVQAMSDGGELQVTAEADKNKRIVVKVQDTGGGISPENLPHIFDPFFTTKEVGQGTGLGLSVSYGIIKKHGGRIDVDSRQDKGSIFTVVIPTREETIDG
jgi:two-component system NtrC family sensor kinase